MKYPGAGIPAMERAAGLNDDNCYRFMGLYRNLIWTKEYMDFLSREEADSAAEGEADAAGAEAGKGFAAEAAIGRIAGDQILKLMTLGLTEEEAEEKILDGFLQ